MKKSLRFLIFAILLLPMIAFAESSPAPWIQTDKDVYAVGEEIRVFFSHAPGKSSDWIGIAPIGSSNRYVGDFNYMADGIVEGVMIFQSPQPGNYAVRAYYNHNPLLYIVTASYSFKVVTQEEYGYGDDGYYDAPITYGEPCYYPPPIAVTFLFDYFTYELSGSYIDIVFWKGGHPRHRKPWRDHGKWVTDDDIHSGQWHHKISGDDLNRHRDKLKANNNIVHPDTYYGIKPGHQVRTGKNVQVTGKNPQPGNKQIPKVFQPGQWERKSSPQIPKAQVTGQPSSQTEHKTGSKREESKDKEKRSEESSGQAEQKTDSNWDEPRQKDNHSQSGWGWGSQSQSSDNHSQSGAGSGWGSGSGWGGGGSSSGRQDNQAPSWGGRNDRRGR